MTIAVGIMLPVVLPTFVLVEVVGRVEGRDAINHGGGAVSGSVIGILNPGWKPRDCRKQISRVAVVPGVVSVRPFPSSVARLVRRPRLSCRIIEKGVRCSALGVIYEAQHVSRRIVFIGRVGAIRFVDPLNPARQIVKIINQEVATAIGQFRQPSGSIS